MSPSTNPSIDPTSALAALMAANRRLRESPAPIAEASPPRAADAAAVCTSPLAILYAIGLARTAEACFPGLEGRVAVVEALIPPGNDGRSRTVDSSCGGADRADHVGRADHEDHEDRADHDGHEVHAASSRLPQEVSGPLGVSGIVNLVARVEREAVPLVVLLIDEVSPVADAPAPDWVERCRDEVSENLLAMSPRLRAALRARRTRVVAGVATAEGEVRWLGEHPRQAELLREPPGDARPDASRRAR